MMQRLLAGYRRCWLAIASRPSTMPSCAPSYTPAPWAAAAPAAAAAAAGTRPTAVRWSDLHAARAPHRHLHTALRQQQLWAPDRPPVLGLPALAPLRVPPCPFTHRHSSLGLRPPSPDAERAAQQHLRWQHTHSSPYLVSSSPSDHHQQEEQQQEGVAVQEGAGGASTAPNPACPEAEALQRPWRPVVAACAAAALLCYLTRANISTAIVPMSADLQWDKATSANVLSSFFAGYSLTQVLGGHLADRWGGAPVLAAGVAVWSLCAALGPAAAELGVPAMLATRFGLGVAQGVAFPAIHALMARHVPSSRHSASIGMIMGAAYTGTVLAFGACPPLIAAMGWAPTFYLAGAAALLWVPQWLHMTRQTAAAEAAAAAARSGRPPAAPQGRRSSSSSSSRSSSPGLWSPGQHAAGVSDLLHGHHLQQPSIELHRSTQQQQEAPPPTWLHWRPLPDEQYGTASSSSGSSNSGISPRQEAPYRAAGEWQPGSSQGHTHAVPQPNWLLQHQHPHLWGSRVLRRRHAAADTAGHRHGTPLDGSSSGAVGPEWHPVALGGQHQQHGWAAAAAEAHSHYSSGPSPHVISLRNGSIQEAAGEPAVLAACTSSSSSTAGMAGVQSAFSQPSFDRGTSSSHAGAASSSTTGQLPGGVDVGVWPLMRRREVWAIAIAQYTSAWGFYGLLAWLPTFFMEHCGVSLSTLGGYTVGPYVLQALVGASAGLLADRLINQQGWRVRDVRVAMQVAGMLGPALCMTAAASPAGAASPLLAASLLTLGMGASALTCSGVSVSHLDIAPRHAGVIFGFGNTASTLAGLVAVPSLGYVVQHLDSWGLAFGLAAAHNMVGALLWARWAGDRPLPEDGPQCLSSRGVAGGGVGGVGKGALQRRQQQAACEQGGGERVGQGLCEGQADSCTDISGWRWDNSSMRLRPASP